MSKTDDFIFARQDFSHEFNQCMLSVEDVDELVSIAKKEAITELLALHEQDRAKVNSQCDTLINMSTVRKYLEGLGV